MPDPRTVSQPATGHAANYLWFWAWAAVGALAALGLVSLGPIALAPAMLAGAAMTAISQARRSASGLLAGAGLLFLFIAYLQREGPGTTCWHTATAAGCDQHLSPIPWLVAGVILLAGALWGQGRR